MFGQPPFQFTPQNFPPPNQPQVNQKFNFNPDLMASPTEKNNRRLLNNKK